MHSGGVQKSAAGAPQLPPTAAFWEEMEMQKKESQELQAKIETFCSLFCPEQMHLAPFLSIEFCGREEELEGILSAMYGHSLSKMPRAKGDEEKEKGAHSTGGAVTDSDNDFMAQAVALSSFFGLGRHFVPAVYAQTKRTRNRRRMSWGAWLPRDEEEWGAVEGVGKEEERHIKQTVLFEVIAALFPDFLCTVLEEGDQRTAFVAKRLAAFLSFHEPESDVKKYLVSHGGRTYFGRSFRNVFMKHYFSFLKECSGTNLSLDDLDEVGSLSSSSVVTIESAGGGEDTTSRRRKTKAVLREWTTAYGLRAHSTPMPSRSCPELNNVAVDTEELSAMERMRAIKLRLSRTEMGTMTQSQPPAFGFDGTKPATRRFYGTGAPFWGGAHNEIHAAAARWKQSWLQNPEEHILPNPSIVLETNSCQKCLFLEAQLAETKAAFQRASRKFVANEEQQYYNEASCYAKQKEILYPFDVSEVNGSSSKKFMPQHFVQPSHGCLMCQDLRQRIKCLEQRLRESYDNCRELTVKLRRSQLPPPPHMCVISSSVNEVKKRDVSTMTELTGQKLDECIGYMILESL
ncbi:hypothetical protein TCDM_04737 [Trypanosoma cruzi Dm28c]|uniref:Uncharacterized protein n=1 Tax=Trypanosoma cruzi Dm28c TaxID=1416333 RepID=V5DGU5_TRYCR|nr:hypothetical protein TCDM_04737 [Trypanosoma cruzi Dm28c]PBJ69950.1 hypothetical protein BCY84_18961 [Trypanosoma cruzi cruzi]